jgi:hypothetical protein
VDGDRFDDWARSFAASSSRRGVLRGLLGGAAAGALGLAGARGAGAVACRTPGELCRENANCCSRLCVADTAGRHVCQCRTEADCPPPTNKCLAATCAGGVCGTAPAVHCAALDQCHLAGTCDPSTGVCSNPNAPNGTACDDGNRCTQTDACQGGTCVGGNPIACRAEDQCYDVGTCDPATGRCSSPAKADGTACTDQDACTQTDTCRGGVCTGSNPVVCAPPDQCHRAGVCNSATGNCDYAPVADGTPCDDGDQCTVGDTCRAGTCTPGPATPCAASDQCHLAGTCNPATGVCSNPAKPNGTACDDGNACTRTDTCQNGVCTGSNPVACTASDQCHVAGACDPATGTCSNPAKPDGTACNDGNLCTSGDTCRAGVCTAGAAKACAASDQCHQAGTCDPTTGTCSNPAKPNGTACNDGNPCTANDVCNNGVCAGTKVADGTACNDGNNCTTGDHCQAGVCTGGTPVVCTALDQCHTAGTCDPRTGACSNPTAPNGTACTTDDGSSGVCRGGACSGPGTCPAGSNSCAAGVSLACNGLSICACYRTTSNATFCGIFGDSTCFPPCNTDADCPGPGWACVVTTGTGAGCLTCPTSTPNHICMPPCG